MGTLDLPFIEFIRRTLTGIDSPPPQAESILVNDVWQAGLFGRTHIVDVTADDPDHFRFIQYGLAVRFENGKDYTNQTLRQGGTPVMADLARRDYRRVKTERRRDLALIRVCTGGRAIVYRRMIQPLLDSDRRKISHLLIGVMPDVQEVGSQLFH